MVCIYSIAVGGDRNKVAMPGYTELLKRIFKHSDEYEQHRCTSCGLLLKDAVQIACGHRLCKSCADDIIKAERAQAQCPQCGEPFEEEEDGAQVSHALWSSYLRLHAYIRLHWLSSLKSKK